MKRTAAVILCLALLLCLASPALAADDRAVQAAQELYSLGLFQGTGVNADGSPEFSLDRVPTRNEAVTMLVRLLGRESEALSGSWDTPFTDLVSWAEPYVGLAYENGLTDGVADKAFGGGGGVTGAQYITLVLRALGYSDSEGDFKWDEPWSLSDKLGLTSGEYGAFNNKSFTRGDVAIVSAAALDIDLKGTDTPLRDTIASDGSSLDLEARALSDAQLSALKGKSPAELKAAISTVGDAVAYLDMRFPTLWTSYHMWLGSNSDEFVLRSGEDILKADSGPDAGRGDIATALAYLLGDDYNITAVFGFSYMGTELLISSANCIAHNGAYTFFDPVKNMKGGPGSEIESLLFPEVSTSSMAEFAKLAASGQAYASIYSLASGAELRARESHMNVTLLSPSVEPFYSDGSLYEEVYGHVKAENIGKYRLSKELGGVTLTVDEANALVDASPETVKAKVKTAGDLLMYMLACRIELCTDFSVVVDGWSWHYNYNAKEVIEKKTANCGASANLANYLLEGDYEDIGFILQGYYPGMGGGHVYNYIKYGGKYYIVDFSSYLFSNYSVENEQKLLSLDRLSDYGGRVSELYGGVCLVAAHSSTGQHLPNVFADKSGPNGESYFYLPKGSDYQLIYQDSSSSSYKLAELALDLSKCPRLDWTKFW